MRNTLIYLYEHSEQYTELIDYMKQAMEERYFKKYVTDYEIAHKYGAYGGAFNDVGIVYTEQPYILAVYTDGVRTAYPEEVVARINEQVCAYNVEKAQEEPPEELVPEETEIVEEPAEPEEENPEPESEEQTPEEDLEEAPEPGEIEPAEAAETEEQLSKVDERLWLVDRALVVTVLVFGVSAFGVVLAIRRRRRKRGSEDPEQQTV